MINIHEHVPLAPLTTFDIGGNARLLVDVHSEDQAKEALCWARDKEIPFVVLAGGSNVLIPDEGIDALVIRMSMTGIIYDTKSVSIYGNTHAIRADAGCNLFTLIKAMAKRGLGGWEKLAGIPGSLGGAVRGNAGAFGTEIKDVIVSVRAMHTITGEVREFSNRDCGFAYRMSFFKKHPEWLILDTQIALQKIDSNESLRRIEETVAEREKRHIQNIKAAGSYFINPRASQSIQNMFEKEKGVASREGRVPAGWLIEKAGLKGLRIGGAMSSAQHPNYVVNAENATAQDVRELARAIKKGIYEQFGITLEEEVALL